MVFLIEIMAVRKVSIKVLIVALDRKIKKKNIKKNLKIVSKKISKNSKKIFLLNQIHSNKFIYIDENFKPQKKIKADAVITNQKNIPIAILTADCVPLLLYDDKKHIIAAIHAGWRGAFKNIIYKVIHFMLRKGFLLRMGIFFIF